MWDLIPHPGIKPRSLALGVQSLSHWTTGEVPGPLLDLDSEHPSLQALDPMGLPHLLLTLSLSP